MPPEDIEGLFTKAADAVRHVGRAFLDDRACPEFAGILAALAALEDSEYLWKCRDLATLPEEKVDRETLQYMKDCRRRIAAGFDVFKASAATKGEVRLLALYEIDSIAIRISDLASALEHRVPEEAESVRGYLCVRLVRAVRGLHAPGMPVSPVDPPPDAEALAWRALLAWESSGKKRKWEPVNQFLAAFGLQAESAAALRHTWAVREKNHVRDLSSLNDHMRTDLWRTAAEEVESILKRQRRLSKAPR